MTKLHGPKLYAQIILDMIPKEILHTGYSPTAVYGDHLKLHLAVRYHCVLHGKPRNVDMHLQDVYISNNIIDLYSGGRFNINNPRCFDAIASAITERYEKFKTFAPLVCSMAERGELGHITTVVD